MMNDVTPARTIRIDAWDMATPAGTVTVQLRRRGELWEVVTLRSGVEVAVETVRDRGAAESVFASAVRAGLRLLDWVEEVRA